MYCQRPQAVLLDQIGDVRAIGAAADADDAVVRFAAAITANAIDDRVETAAAFGAGKQFRSRPPLIVRTMTAPTRFVERDVLVAGVHDATDAHLRRDCGTDMPGTIDCGIRGKHRG